jgi:hypothetical protein
MKRVEEIERRERVEGSSERARERPAARLEVDIW